MRSLACTVPTRLVIPFGVWFSFIFNLLFGFGSDSHSRCHSSYSKLLILFPKSEATIVFEASFSDRASFAASSASSVTFYYADMTWNPAKNDIFTSGFQLIVFL